MIFLLSFIPLIRVSARSAATMVRSQTKGQQMTPTSIGQQQGTKATKRVVRLFHDITTGYEW